jgi:ABC-type glycerol-3-phosphate transport system substrate-binding protein
MTTVGGFIMSLTQHSLTRRRFLQGVAAAAPSAMLLSSSAGTTFAQSGHSTIDTQQNVTISLAHWWGEQFAHYIPIIKQQVGIDVSEQRTPYPEFDQKLLTQLAGNTAPDVFLWDANNNGSLFNSNATVPFDDYLAANNVDMSKWNIPPSQEVGFDGKIMGLSTFTMQDLIVHVNKQLADQDGLLANAPLWGTDRFDTWRWDDFVNWLKAGTKTANGQVQQYGLSSGDTSYLAVLFRALVADNGGGIFDDDWNYNETTSLLDQPPALDAAQKIVDLITVHKVAPLPGEESAIQGGTYLAKRAMAAINWSTPSIFPEENTFPQEHFHLPYINNRVHAVGGNALMVNRASPNVDAAQEWILRFNLDDQVRTTFLQVSSVPAYDPLPIVNGSPEGTPKTIALINLARISNATSIPQDAAGVTLYPRWYGQKASKFTQQSIADALSKAILGSSSVKDAFSEAKQAVDAQLNT